MSLPNISNTNISIFLVSQHNEPINSTLYSHLQVNTDVVFPQIIFVEVAYALSGGGVASAQEYTHYLVFTN